MRPDHRYPDRYDHRDGARSAEVQGASESAQRDLQLLCGAVPGDAHGGTAPCILLCPPADHRLEYQRRAGGYACVRINSGAYISEIMRSGIQSVDPGQMEAGRAVGLSFGASMTKIVIPQAVKNILPTLGNEFIALIKETSVVSFVGAADLYVAFNYIGTNNYEFMVPYLVMALIYIAIVLVITLLIKLLERSLKKSDRRN